MKGQVDFQSVSCSKRFNNFARRNIDSGNAILKRPSNLQIGPMKIDDNTIDHIAKLARLRFSESEKAAIKGDLERILDLVEVLNEVDTIGVEPLIHMTETTDVLREDEVTEEITKEEALLNAPKKDSDYFKVPKVISGNQ